MNRKIAKLIRGFSKATSMNYRSMKEQYYSLSEKERNKAKQNLLKFWKDSPDVLNHKKYYDLKIPLKKPSAVTKQKHDLE
jgi:hypothetical protein